MVTVSSSSERKRKQRVAAACDFCRRRKLGCDNKKPKCTKCSLHGRECTYSERPRSERPSNSRIAHLLDENDRLRQSLEALQRSRSPSTPDPIHEEPLDHRSPEVGTPVSSHPAAEATATIATKFHGPSSALHHWATDIPSDSRSTKIDDGQVKKDLFAEAARQRQLERINLVSGKLDFEGIDASLGSELLQTFWNRQHHSGTVVYRPAFMRDMACHGPNFSSLLLNAMLFVAVKHPPLQLSNDTASQSCVNGITFRRKAEALLYQADTPLLSKSILTTAQALLLMADALFSWCDERSLSWHYLGMAISMIVDLGLHTARSAFYCTRSAEDQEIGRRVFWSAYVADKVQSIYQGRPPRLRDTDCMVPIQFLDEYDEFEAFHSLSYSATPSQLDTPARSGSTFEQLCKLSVIAESILAKLYGEKSFLLDPRTLLQASLSLKIELEQWRCSLPPHLDLVAGESSPFNFLPHTLSLLSMYYSLIIILFRPFVSDGHLQTLDPSNANSAFTTCANAATQINNILNLYKQHFCLKTCPYFISYATYASGTIHARIAAQNLAGSQSRKMLLHCLDVLSQQQVQCHAPRQSLKILLVLAKRLGVNVGTVTAAWSRTDTDADDQFPEFAPTNCFQLIHEPTTIELNEISGLDANLDALDIDAIMRSFDQISQHAAPANNEFVGRTRVVGNCGRSDVTDDSFAGTGISTSLQGCDFDLPSFSVDNAGIFLDPLIGFEF
ncbi:hypothetical protein DM02DRAFT_730552 [Periconia macrospinosa]|uniref:Zn(2)-C6 fungal-type domain-containing protein n=1 Tax=Periconia macrospinosa TaxID=97972 RepID=A0A2V1DIM8_9PLEO|nr:hypothetical protein DM02DRAFT_730552 [Periconia macrospinosa]